MPKQSTTDVVAVPDSTTAVMLPDDPQLFINKELEGLDNYVPDTWEDLVEYVSGEIITFQGSPWEVIKKEALVGIPFMIADVRHYEGKFGDAVAVMVLTQAPLVGHTDARYVINDGSTGVYQQIVYMLARAKRKTGIMCPNGLRFSEYDYQPVDLAGEPMGNPIPAKTYYIA